MIGCLRCVSYSAENEYSVSFNESGEKVYTQIENDTYTYDANRKDKLTSFYASVNTTLDGICAVYICLLK